jgi:hypothetical protein
VLGASAFDNKRGTAHAADEHGLTNVGGPHKLNVQCFRTHCEAIQLLFAEDDQRLDRVQRVVGQKDPLHVVVRRYGRVSGAAGA